MTSNAKTLILALLLGASAQGAEARGLSPATKALLDRVGTEAPATDGRRMAPSAKSESDMVRMFMRYNHISALDSVEAVGGIAVTLPTDWLATVSLPAGEIEHIGSIAQVDYLEVGGDVTLLTDRVRRYASVDGVQDGTRTGGVPYTGKGVVLGVIDAGLEYNHLNFRDADGNNRIKRIWVQTGSLGKHPAKFDYGAEYTSPEQIAALTCDTRETYHATHVMGIAAGSDDKSVYTGMAPDTELVYVRFGGTAEIADAIQYIFDYADEVDKPCVINMSLGAHQGPHDGTSDLDRVIDASVGPGRIIVGAAGNEGTATMHAGKTFTDDDTVMKAMLASNSKEARIDVWGEPGADIKLSVGITNAAKGTIVAESKQFTADDAEADFGFNYEQTLADVSFSVYPSRTPDNRSNFLIIVYGGSKYFNDSRKVFIKVEGPSGSTAHMWNVAAEDFVVTTRQGWTSGDNHCTIGEVGGTAKRIISVGSFDSRNTLPYYLYPEAGDDAIDCEQLFGVYTLEGISDFSSRGPTTDGRMKPDVCAGGRPVVSSISQYCQDLTMPFDPSNCIARTKDSAGKYHYYSIDAGTSMASPAVAGIVALWLEANPELTPEMVSEVLRKTSSVDRYTGSRGNNNAGYGKVHALNGIRYVLKGEFEGAGLGDIVSDGYTSRAWAADGNLSVVSPVAGTVTLTSVSGVRLLAVPVEAGLSTVVEAGTVAHGIYVVTMPDGTNIKVAL